MSTEPEQVSMMHPLSPEPTVVERIAELAERPDLSAADYWLPMGQPSEERVQDELEKEVQALKLLQRMAKFGITGRDKVIFYFGVLHYILDDQRNLDKPMTWAEFRRFFNRKLAAYCEGRHEHD